MFHQKDSWRFCLIIFDLPFYRRTKSRQWKDKRKMDWATSSNIISKLPKSDCPFHQFENRQSVH